MFGRIVEKPEIRIYAGRVEYDEDFLEKLTGFIKEKNIRFGKFSAIGALRTARLGYYDQVAKKYDSYDVDGGPFELLSAEGNISLSDDSPFPHIHVVVSDGAGKTAGGHLTPGCAAFNVEFFIEEIANYELTREYDETTKLKIWK
jgi:predicted DNA-binding protein with PD1-like motif